MTLSSLAQMAPSAPSASSGPSAATPGTPNNPVNTMRFDVTIDGIELGAFTGFEGLAFTYDVKTYEEGGENGFVHALPGRLKYENIKISRPLDSSSPALARYFASLAKDGKVSRGNATVKAYNDNSEPIATWTFTGVYPVRYSGPSFTVDGGKAASETLEFAHRGLLP